MSYLDLMQLGSGAFIAVLLVGLLFTLLCYSAFPIIFALVRKKPVTRKKYRWLCIGVNLIPAVFVSSSFAPYVLWTWVFSAAGGKILKKRGLLEETAAAAPADAAPKESPAPEAASSASSGDAPEKLCRSCGSALPEGCAFCTSCGAAVEPEQPEA